MKNTQNSKKLNVSPDILIDYVRITIKSRKEGKSPGPDKINSEFLKLFDITLVRVAHIRVYNLAKKSEANSVKALEQ